MGISTNLSADLILDSACPVIQLTCNKEKLLIFVSTVRIPVHGRSQVSVSGWVGVDPKNPPPGYVRVPVHI